MAYFPSFSFYFTRNISDTFKRIPVRKYCTNPEEVKIAVNIETHQPVQKPTHQNPSPPPELQNPYLKEKRKCVLCKYNIEPDYKNVRLLSQFVSNYTGKIIPRHVAGICPHKYKAVIREIKKAKDAGLMPRKYKFPEFFADPPLFDIEGLSKPRRVV